MNKAVCYVRSGPLEVEMSDTVGKQDQFLSSYCDSVHLDSLMTIRDERTLASVPLEDRLGGKDLLEITESAVAQHIVIWRLDRLFRSAGDAHTYLTLWKTKNVCLHIADFHGVSLRSDSEAGLIFCRTIASLSQMGREWYSERVKTDISMKKSNHFLYGITPFGFEVEGNQLIPNSREQEIVRMIKHWRESGWTLRQIANELNQLGVPTKQAESGKKPTRWYASTVRYLLANKLYESEE